VLAALAISGWTEYRTGWSIRKFVRTDRRYRTIEIQAGDHVITAAGPLPRDLHEALDRIPMRAVSPGQDRYDPGTTGSGAAGARQSGPAPGDPRL
jgi:hypothetical protein